MVKPDLQHEQKLGYPRVIVIGVDEVGRGCLAGPVVAGALALPLERESVSEAAHSWIGDVADSKLVNPETRERLAPLIEAWAAASSVGVATVEEIDRINIYHASHLAMRRAVQGVVERLRSAGIPGDAHILIDGNAIPREMPYDCTAIVKGDMKCLSIAAASILAKVWRDHEMEKYDAVHPGYGFAAHKGYSTPAHSKALTQLGPCAIHRRSFAPVAALLPGANLELF